MVGNLADSRVCLQPLHVPSLDVDSMDPALETAGTYVGQQLVPDRVNPSTGPDHGNRLREQRGAHAQRLGAVLSRDSNSLRLFSRLDREGHRDHAVVEVVVDLVPGLGEDLDHLAVLWQDVSHELGYPQLLSDGCEVLQ